VVSRQNFKKHIKGLFLPILKYFCRFHFRKFAQNVYFEFIEGVYRIKIKYSRKMFHCFKFNGDIQLQAINMKFKLITNIFPDNLDDHGNTLLKVHAYKNN